jgi:hypothetical protein
MEAASAKIRHVYEDTGNPARYQMKFYDVPHQFNAQMQEEAFAWLDRWLK